MLLPRRKLATSFGWTAGMQTVSMLMRFVTSVALARLLSPDILGASLIVTTIRLGVELLADTGFMQFLVSNKDGNEPRVQNTVWTLQIVRGIILSIVTVLAAGPLSRYYEINDHYVWFAAGVSLVYGFQAPAYELMKKQLQVARVTTIEFAVELAGVAIMILAAVIQPTIVSLLAAHVAAALVKVIVSHAVSTNPMRLRFDRSVIIDSLHFGKWMFLSSGFMFLCTNFDRLYLGSLLSLAAFGVYGIARSLSEIPNMFAQRIGYVLVFPMISAASGQDRETVRGHLAPLRRQVLAAAAVAFAVGVAISDLFVRLVYDQRYGDATWMLPLLLVGVWPSVINSIGECVLLGVGRPSYISAANAAKLAFVFFVVPLGFSQFGMVGAIVAVAFSDLARSVPMAIGQWRENLSFLRQDAAATLLFLVLLALALWLRVHLGLGTPFDHLRLGGA